MHDQFQLSEAGLPFTFETKILTRYKVRTPRVAISLKEGEEYHIYLENLTRRTIKKQGVEQILNKRKDGRYEFTLSKRLRKLFQENDNIKVTIHSLTADFYRPNNFLGEKVEKIEDVFGKWFQLAFLYKVGESRGIIVEEYNKKEEVKKLYAVNDTYDLLTQDRTSKDGKGRLKIDTMMYDEYSVIRCFNRLKKYNLRERKEKFYPEDYYTFFEKEKAITVYCCLLIVTSTELAKFFLAKEIINEINRFFYGKLTLGTIRDELIQLAKKVKSKLHLLLQPKIAAEEAEIDNCLSTQTMLDIMNHSSACVFRAIMFQDNGKGVLREKIEEYVNTHYKIKDKEYLSKSLLYLLDKGIICRITNKEGKICFKLVRYYERKR